MDACLIYMLTYLLFLFFSKCILYWHLRCTFYIPTCVENFMFYLDYIPYLTVSLYCCYCGDSQKKLPSFWPFLELTITWRWAQWMCWIMEIFPRFSMDAMVYSMSLPQTMTSMVLESTRYLLLFICPQFSLNLFGLILANCVFPKKSSVKNFFILRLIHYHMH